MGQFGWWARDRPKRRSARPALGRGDQNGHEGRERKGHRLSHSRRALVQIRGLSWRVLVQCAFAAARAKNTYLQAQFLRLKARRGPKKAAIAVAASILTAVYHMLRDGTFFRDLGPDHFARYDKTRAAMRLVRRIKDLGYDVEIKAAA